MTVLGGTGTWETYMKHTGVHVLPGHAKGGMLVGTDCDGRSRSKGVNKQIALSAFEEARTGKWIL